MRLIKKVVTCTLSAALIFSSMIGSAGPVEASDNQLNIKINNIIYNKANQPTPVNINGRVYVPLRLVSEGLGHSVVWDSATRTILIDSSLNEIDTMTALSSLVIFIDNKQLQVDTATGQPFITPQGYTMVPIRIIAENLGANVVWANSTQTVEISTQTPTIIDTPVEKPKENTSDNKQGTQPSPAPAAPVDDDSLTAEKVTIMGASYSTLDQMKRFTAAKEAQVKARARANGDVFVPFPENIAEYYYTIGKKYNIRGDVALAQAMLETGCFQYGNEVKPWQNNFCGLGATGSKVTEEDCETYAYSLIDHDRAWLVPDTYGWFYDSVATGVEAHIQHLYSYATTAALPAGVERLDGRFFHSNRGKGIYLTDLNGRWAVPGDNYGQNIFSSYLEPMMNS
jgi:hypothetical protein